MRLLGCKLSDTLNNDCTHVLIDPSDSARFPLVPEPSSSLHARVTLPLIRSTIAFASFAL
jgi:hypothetical protein